jgi:hypothetical protein
MAATSGYSGEETQRVMSAEKYDIFSSGSMVVHKSLLITPPEIAETHGATFQNADSALLSS